HRTMRAACRRRWSDRRPSGPLDRAAPPGHALHCRRAGRGAGYIGKDGWTRLGTPVGLRIPGDVRYIRELVRGAGHDEEQIGEAIQVTWCLGVDRLGAREGDAAAFGAAAD